MNTLAPADALDRDQLWVQRLRLMDWIVTMAVKKSPKRNHYNLKRWLDLVQEGVRHFLSLLHQEKKSLIYYMCTVDDQWAPKLTRAIKLVNIYDVQKYLQCRLVLL